MQTTTNIARKTLNFRHHWFSHVSVTMFDLVIACADQCFDSRVNKGLNFDLFLIQHDCAVNISIHLYGFISRLMSFQSLKTLGPVTHQYGQLYYSNILFGFLTFPSRIYNSLVFLCQVKLESYLCLDFRLAVTADYYKWSHSCDLKAGMASVLCAVSSCVWNAFAWASMRSFVIMMLMEAVSMCERDLQIYL